MKLTDALLGEHGAFYALFDEIEEIAATEDSRGLVAHINNANGARPDDYQDHRNVSAIQGEQEAHTTRLQHHRDAVTAVARHLLWSPHLFAIAQQLRPLVSRRSISVLKCMRARAWRSSIVKESLAVATSLGYRRGSGCPLPDR